MTQKALNLEFILVPGPNVDLMKRYEAYNHQTKQALPVTLIVDRNELVRWKYVGKDISDRPGRGEIIAQLRLLQ